VARAGGIKVVMTHHGPDYMRAKWGGAAKTILKLGESSGVRSASAVITISNGIREHIKSLYGREAVIIPNGVTMPAPVAPGPMMELFGLKPREYVFTACRFVPEKGLEVLIEAYRALKSPAFKRSTLRCLSTRAATSARATQRPFRKRYRASARLPRRAAGTSSS
jgi:glycosyltransferase involved in cell wall biosynthesis